VSFGLADAIRTNLVEFVGLGAANAGFASFWSNLIIACLSISSTRSRLPGNEGRKAVGTNFLGAGFIAEQINDIYEQARYLQKLLQLTLEEREELIDSYAAKGYYTTFESEIGKALNAVVEGSRQTCEFMNNLQCQPLIYTGDGDTDQVIDLLERLMILHQTSMGTLPPRRKLGS